MIVGATQPKLYQQHGCICHARPGLARGTQWSVTPGFVCRLADSNLSEHASGGASVFT